MRNLVICLCLSLPAQGQELSSYLPADTPAVLETSDAAGVLQHLTQLVPADAGLGLMSVGILVKGRTGMTPEDLLQELLPEAACLAQFPHSTGNFPVLLARLPRPDGLYRLARRFPAAAYDWQEGVFTLCRNPQDLEKALAFRQGEARSLADLEQFAQYPQAMAADDGLSLYLNLADRPIPASMKALLGEFSSLHARLLMQDQGLHVQVQVIDARGSKRTQGSAKPAAQGLVLPPAPADAMLSLSLRSDIRSFLQQADSLLDEDGATKVKTFISQADVLFGRYSLVDDVLPQLGQPMNFYVSESRVAKGVPQPLMQLPAFTLVIPISDVPTQQLLYRSMRTVVQIANAQRRRLQKVPWVVDIQKAAKPPFQSATLQAWPGSGEPPTEHGLSLTLLFHKGYGVFSSTTDGALRVVQALDQAKSQVFQQDQLLIKGSVLASYLQRNLELLVLDRVLKEGESPERARVIWQLLVAVAEKLQVEVRRGP